MSAPRPRSTPVRRRALAWQVVRKCTQLAVLGAIVYAAVGTHWRNFKVAHNSERLVGLLTDPWTAWLYGLNDRALTALGEVLGTDALSLSEDLLGAPWALRLGDVALLDPWATGTVLVQGEVPPLVVAAGALLPLLLAVVLGKVFCSFLCPARLVFELASGVRLGLLRLGLPLAELRLPRLGLGIGAGALLFAASAGAGIMHLLLPYLALSNGILTLTLTGGLGAAGAVFVAMVLVDVLVAPGQVCHALCPTGALLGVLGQGARLRLAKEPTPCPPTCTLCRRACPYGLFPGQQTHRPACDTCGRCAAFCPEDKLSPRLALRIQAGRPVTIGARDAA